MQFSWMFSGTFPLFELCCNYDVTITPPSMSPLHHGRSLFYSQRFANNDHLGIHKTKHELSLKLGGRSEVLLVGKSVYACFIIYYLYISLSIDQTPTPTRFLRNCEETGLFQELEANPFDRVKE